VADLREARPVVRRISSGLMDAVSILRPGFDKHYITLRAGSPASPRALFAALGRFLREHDAAVVVQDVFGSRALQPAGLRALAQTCGPVDWPVTWVCGEGCDSACLRGTQVHAVARGRLERVCLDGRAVGAAFEDQDARYCLHGDVRTADPATPRPAQVRETFERLELALRAAGMDYSHVVRTWLYLDDILAWYDTFNEARTAFYEQRRVFDGLLPASTGVGATNPAGAAIVADLFALKPKHAGVRVEAVASPLQCPAPRYRSSFSRAVEVTLPDHRRLYVSGTAAIAPDGSSAHRGDIDGQIELTMQVVAAILRSRGMDWADTSRAVAYFKDMADLPAFARYAERTGLPRLPLAVSHADICRDELLFELEVDAVRAR
jgi:enamine deaminase RidA (YjgF/YER057c/UK114 family)